MDTSYFIYLFIYLFTYLLLMCTLNATDRAKSLEIAQRCLSLCGRASGSKFILIALTMLCPIKISYLFM